VRVNHLAGFFWHYTDNWQRRWRRTRSSSASWTGDWNTASLRDVFMPFSLFVAPGDGGGTDPPRSRTMLGMGR